MMVLLSTLILVTGSTGFDNNQRNKEDTITIHIEWAGKVPEGKIEIYNGKLNDIFILDGKGKVTGDGFYFKPGKRYRLGVSISNVRVQPGPGATVITVDTKEKGFSFVLRDEDILYKTRTFVTLVGSPLKSENLRGTHYLVADGYSGGHTFTAEQQSEFEKQEKTELSREETTVLCFRAAAVNTSKALRYAWFKFPETSNYQYNAADGFGQFSADRIFCISKLNGKPAPCEEISVLLAPGDSAVFEFYIPHTPVARDRALKLREWDFEDQVKDCRSFWEKKLLSASRIHLPEKRIEEMVYAGLLHLDLITYGLEQEGTLAPTIGVYSPIGSESSPIIQFMNSMGWHETARRSVQYFLDKQHENGFMQNFGGYMLETGAALFTMGEYFRYTRDTEFVKMNMPKIIKACEYLISEQDSNKRDDLKGKGYGMMVGKVADKNDHYHSFMLNGYNYLGLSRSAEMLAGIDPVVSERIRLNAEELKKNIHESFFSAMKRSPLMPLDNGTWVPSVPPWPDTKWLPQLFLEPHKMYSHAHFTVRYATTGPLYLVYQEVISPDEPAAGVLLAFHAEHLYQRNTVFSQPYYSRHDWLQLKRGMVKPFLKTYYNTFPAISDRETYTFWEHIHQVSPHKTHEEAWFLMQTRWMLYLEEGQTLKLLAGVPRAWLENGKTISLENVASYFGPLSFHVKSAVEKGFIEATIDCTTDRKPKDIIMRLPHPTGRKPVKVTGGIYDETTETVHIASFTGHAGIKLTY